MTSAPINNTKGAAAVVLAVFALSLGDAIIKGLSDQIGLWQLFTLRSVLALPILFLVIKCLAADLPLAPVSLRWTVLRSLLLGLMWVVYYPALPFVKLSVAVAAYYTAPLFIILLGAFFTGAKPGLLGWFAVVFGFCGAMIMLRPDAGSFNAYALLPILAAVLYALAMLLTRAKCREESPLVLALNLNMTLICIGGFFTLLIITFDPQGFVVSQNPFLFSHWVKPDFPTIGFLILLAVLYVVGSIFAAVAYQLGEPHVVATFDYAYLIFGVLWGVLIFAEKPDLMTLTGMAMILLAGTVVAVFQPVKGD